MSTKWVPAFAGVCIPTRNNAVGYRGSSTLDVFDELVDDSATMSSARLWSPVSVPTRPRRLAVEPDEQGGGGLTWPEQGVPRAGVGDVEGPYSVAPGRGVAQLDIACGVFEHVSAG